MTRTQARKRRKAIRKVWKYACGTVAFLGFMLMLGTAGSSDLDLIPFSQIVVQSSIGLAMLYGGLTLGGFLE